MSGHRSGTRSVEARRERPGSSRVRCALRLAAGGAALSLAAACSAPAADPSQPALETARGLSFTTLAEGLSQPVDVAAPPGDPRLFVVEQTGRIRVLADGRLRERPFLDLADRVSRGYERGLLGLAFHPHYRQNGWLFVNYTDPSGDTQVERYTVSRDPDVADPASRQTILSVPQPYRNHNGGCIRFGPDGMLYIGMGDGGSGGDPQRHAQHLGSLLGKLLRIDVNGALPYRTPPDNPFVSRRGARPEIWAYGLRNPWRFAFDPPDSALYIADVGQDRWEEIDVAPARRRGLDYGWNLLEGDECFRGADCAGSGSLRPAIVYGHRQGCSVTGGEVYRGRRSPALVGHYFFADLCDGWIRSVRVEAGRVAAYRQWRAPKVAASGFGTDAAGELLVLDLDGRLLRLDFDDAP